MPVPRRRRRASHAALARMCLGGLAACVVATTGCAGSPRVTRPGTAATPASLEPPPGVAAPAHTLPLAGPVAAVPSPAVAPDGLSAALTRSRQESQLMQDEIVALREQLASTSSQLATVRAAGMPVTAAPMTPGAVPPGTMQSALSGLALPGVDTRFDGAVVRVELPADALFDGGTANLVPGGVALLTQVAGEVGRVYPGHFIGIESHVDTEPLTNASWASPHQLTAARAAAVFDFLTTRTPLRESQLFLVAHGSNHPVVSNATPAGRAKNRRVELVIYPERAPGE